MANAIMQRTMFLKLHKTQNTEVSNNQYYHLIREQQADMKTQLSDVSLQLKSAPNVVIGGSTQGTSVGVGWSTQVTGLQRPCSREEWLTIPPPRPPAMAAKLLPQVHPPDHGRTLLSSPTRQLGPLSPTVSR